MRTVESCDVVGADPTAFRRGSALPEGLQRGPVSDRRRNLQKERHSREPDVTMYGMLPAVMSTVRVGLEAASRPFDMPMTVHHDSDNVYRLEVHGTLRKVEFERCQDVLIDEMGRVGPVRLLFLLDGFEGWEPHDNWSDLTFYIKHGAAIERIAIVGDERWRSLSMMFAAADLRKAPVEFFSPEQVVDARAWLAT
jgi:SpoIIAA-like